MCWREDSKLADPAERARLARVFAGGLAASVGSVLPLKRVEANGSRRWVSGKWHLRAGPLFLFPGDAPMGFRLPLHALPWADSKNIEQDFEVDPFAPQGKLPPHVTLRRADGDRIRGGADGGPAYAGPAYAGPAAAGPAYRGSAYGSPVRGDASGGGSHGRQFGLYGAVSPDGAGSPYRPPMPQDLPVIGREEPEAVRTALTVEPRHGKLHVFFPPLYAAEDWLELVAAVEDTAESFGCQVVLEGYAPPRDPRLNQFSITPDPGVIEVNIHPAENWDEMVTRTEPAL